MKGKGAAGGAGGGEHTWGASRVMIRVSWSFREVFTVPVTVAPEVVAVMLDSTSPVL